MMEEAARVAMRKTPWIVIPLCIKLMGNMAQADRH